MSSGDMKDHRHTESRMAQGGERKPESPQEIGRELIARWPHLCAHGGEPNQPSFSCQVCDDGCNTGHVPLTGLPRDLASSGNPSQTPFEPMTMESGPASGSTFVREADLLHPLLAVRR